MQLNYLATRHDTTDKEYIVAAFQNEKDAKNFQNAVATIDPVEIYSKKDLINKVGGDYHA